MIAYTQFYTLRLNQFLPVTEIEQIENWEFEDRVWVGEAVGFSEWLRLEEEPEALRSLSLNFSDFPPETATHILDVLDLAIRPGMTLKELRDIFGEPRKTYSFAADQATHDFMWKAAEPYSVACTILNEGGLTHIVIMTQLPEKAPDDE
jgi:hypothetical protein